MQFGIFLKTFPGELEEQLAQAQAHQLKVIQFNMACLGLNALPNEVPEGLALKAGDLCKSMDIDIAAVSATFNMAHPNPKIIASGIQQFEAIAKSAHLLQTKYLTLCTGSRDPYDKWKWHPENASVESWKTMCRTMEQLIEIAEKYDVLLGVEPELANIVRTPKLARKLIEDMQTDRIRIVLDAANLFEMAKRAEINDLIDEALDEIGEYVFMAHAKGRTSDGEFCAAGKGDIDFVHYIKALRRHKFEGPMVLHGLQANEVSASLQHLRAI